MSVIVYACALIGINAFAVVADRMNRRGIPLLAACCVSIAGLVMLLTIINDKGRLAGTCILAFGVFATIPINGVWLTVNIAGYTKRGSAAAMMNMIAQAFSIAGNQAFVDPPYCKLAFLHDRAESGPRQLYANSCYQIGRVWRHRWASWLFM